MSLNFYLLGNQTKPEETNVTGFSNLLFLLFFGYIF